MEMEDYLEFICFYYIAKNTDTGFKCKFCSYEGCDRATVMNHIKHVTRAECRGVEIVESTRPLVQNFYDKPPIEASDVQELNDATDRPNIKYALRSRTCIQKKTTGDHSVPTSHQGPSSSNYAVRSRIEKKKTGVSNISTHLSPSSSSKYALTSPMQFKLDMQQTLDLQKKLDIFTKDFLQKNNQYFGHAYSGLDVLSEVAPVMDAAFSEMQNMLAVFKSKLDRIHEDRGPDLVHEVAPVIDASFLEMQNKLAVFKSELKSKLDTAILHCPPSPPPIV